MAQFDIDAFMKGEQIDESSSGKPKLLFTITKVEKKDAYEIFPGKPEVAIVFTVKCEDGSTGELAQGLNNQKGEPRKNMFWGYYWNDNKDKPEAGSVMQDMLMAIKSHIGEEAYEARKKEHNGVNINFWKGAEFKATLASGTSKDGRKYYIVGTPMRDKVNTWDYLVNQGHESSYGSIEEVRALFPDKFATNTPESESEDTDDLPF